MSKTTNTPFAEYREEQVKRNIFDYFVEPSFFEKFCDTKPIIISGARGTGKTTILRALTMSETKNPKQYLTDNNYIGVYYRVDLNITTSFQGQGIAQSSWEKLFSYYFVSKLCYELINQICRFKNEFAILNEEEICQKYDVLFTNKSNAINFEELKKNIYSELHQIRNYINNCAYEQYPHIGDYAIIIRGLPHDLLAGMCSSDVDSKTIFYLIDEFEGLFEWQQKIILSFMKYADKYHTYKICMRPDGIKTSQTIGAEYIRETDDVRTVDLNELILKNRDDYYKYALDVCKKRFDLYCSQKNDSYVKKDIFEELFEEVTEDEEYKFIFSSKSKELNEDIEQFILQNGISDAEIREYFKENYYDFLIFRLLFSKCKKKSEYNNIFKSVVERDGRYKDAVGNYGHALLYYLCLRFSISKQYSGFNTLVNISGGTIRYLLELCNEIFERAVLLGNFDYEKPEKISSTIQTNAVRFISSKRVNQISAIPQLGSNMRTFVISLGKIYRIFHRDDKISKFEVNHFSIKACAKKSNEKVRLFLKECVMRGVLLKKQNNKKKVSNSISADEYIYGLHPIYTPFFQISWRNKQKAEFDLDELSILIGDDTKGINHLIKKYEKKYLHSEDFSESDEYYQTSFDFYGDVL